MEKSKQTRERVPCEHCNTVHNAHKDSEHGCRLTKKPKLPKSKATLAKNTKSKADKALDNLLEVDNLGDALFNAAINYDSEGSRTSSDFIGSAGSSDSDSSVGKSKSGKALGREIESDISLSSQGSSVSFHDSSTGCSEFDDDENPEISDLSDESGEESDPEPYDNEDGDPNWSRIVLTAANSGVFRKKESNYPVFDTLIKAGPINLPPATSEPVDFFHLYFNTDIMADLVDCTNAVGSHFFATKLKSPKGSHLGRYFPTTIAELYRYFAVILHMGIKRQPSMRSYWSQNPRYSDNFVKKCFSRDRFEQIKSFIHVVKAHEFTDEMLKAFQKEDPFWRMTPLLDHLSDLYQRYFKCYQDIDIDEMCIGFKGRHIARCYNPNKPDKWHLKAFCLNDSKTGYLHRFYMYHGNHFFFFFNVPYLTH